MPAALTDAFGNIDIYLFDQLLKGRFDSCRAVLDAGCGSGRNLVYFLRNGFNVFATDQEAEAVAAVQRLAQQLAPALPASQFLQCPLEALPFPDARFDLVICSAVLHFARGPEHFNAMLQELWRVLQPGGFLFVRLASATGIEDLITPVGNGRYLLPDGSTRFLVTEQQLLGHTARLRAELVEPVKTTNVQHLRCMTTWCLRKKPAPAQ